MTHEWNFYVFEGVAILPILFIFAVLHPARFLTNVGFRQAGPSRKEGDDEERAIDGAVLSLGLVALH